MLSSPKRRNEASEARAGVFFFFGGGGGVERERERERISGWMDGVGRLVSHASGHVCFKRNKLQYIVDIRPASNILLPVVQEFFLFLI